jgi:starch synthase
MGRESFAGLVEFRLDRFFPEGFSPEFEGVPLAMGLAAADWISTVSPTYAQEIQTPEYGYGLEGLISSRAGRLTGILNGIDYQIWDPEQDGALQANFNLEQLELRAANKRFLQEKAGLAVSGHIPLLGIISRLDYQKGINLALEALSGLSGEWQLILLGTGDPELEAACREFEGQHAERSRCVLEFNAGLARQIYAGSDMILIPSRYEPCGLAQMIGMRYGNIPVVRSTGGLKDSVRDYDECENSTGFVFHDFDSQALTATLQRAIAVFEDSDSWKALQHRAMQQDFSWDRSAREYASLYRTILERD